MTQKNNDKEPLKILIFSASLRKDSYNTKLAKLAAKTIEKNGGIVDFAQMSKFDCPSMNQDLEVNDFHPDGAKEFRKRLLANDAFVICSPEYNGAIPGLLKNMIDWVSRFHPQPFNMTQALLMSASPSVSGGNMGLWSLRVPLEKLGTRVYPNMFSLALSDKAFNENGSITDEKLQMRLEKNLVEFMNLVEVTKKT